MDAMVQSAFSAIYREKRWGVGCPSGAGSDPNCVAVILSGIANIIECYGVRSILDVGCGWSNWVIQAVGEKVYTGVDVVPAVIEHRQATQYSPHLFQLLDITEAPVPGHHDLILCRDVLNHLPTQHVLRALRNMKASGALLLTTHWPGCEGMKDITVGAWRALNLQLPPFCLPAPLESIQEVHAGKFLCLFDLRVWEG